MSRYQESIDVLEETIQRLENVYKDVEDEFQTQILEIMARCYE